MSDVEIKKPRIAWLRGFNRVFILATVLWALFVFVEIPQQAINRSRESASTMFEYDVEHPTTDEAITKRRLAEYYKTLSDATWSASYRENVFPNIG